MDSMMIHCCECGTGIEARLTYGAEVYSHRPDLAAIPFWKCDSCGNHVGCHYKTSEVKKPLGYISSPELRSMRSQIHKVIDPLWKSKKIKRKELYILISKKIGHNYHTAKIKNIEQASNVLRAAREIARDINNG